MTNEKQSNKKIKLLKKNFAYIDQIFDKKTNPNHFFAAFKLVWKPYYRNFFALFFNIMFPLMLLGLIGAFQTEDGPRQSILAGISMSVLVNSGVTGLGVRLNQWKQTTIIRRIGSTPLRKSVFLGAFVFLLLIFMIFQLLVCWIAYIIFFGANTLPQVDFLIYLPSVFLIMLFGLSLGIFLSAVITNPNTLAIVNLLIFLPPSFLTGIYIPLSEIDKIEALRIISMIFPQRYLVELIYYSFGFWNSDIYSFDSWWLIITYPALITILLSVVAVWKFSWEK